MLISNKQNQGTLKYMALVARDILAIPGVSISVERLFSSLKHTLSNARSSMTAETVSVDIVTKEWLKAGLVEGANYTDLSRSTGRRIYQNIFKIYSYSLA